MIRTRRIPALKVLSAEKVSLNSGGTAELKLRPEKIRTELFIFLTVGTDALDGPFQITNQE